MKYSFKGGVPLILKSTFFDQLVIFFDYYLMYSSSEYIVFDSYILLIFDDMKNIE